MGKKRTRQIMVGNTPLKVDFKLLQKQKRALLDKALWHPDTIDGLVNFLDSFQDASAGVLGETIVFG